MPRNLSTVGGLLIACVAILASGCGTTGKTWRFVLHIPSTTPPTASVRVGSVTVEKDAASLQSVAVYQWGKFTTNDLDNIEHSLRDTLSEAAPFSPDREKQLRVHVVIRKHYVAVSNTAGAALACVAWAATDATNGVVFSEQFYVAHYIYVAGTAGSLKDSVHRTIVRRVVEGALHLAGARDAARGPDSNVPNTFLSFDDAVRHLPGHMVSMGSPPVNISGAPPLLNDVAMGFFLLPSTVQKPQWKEARVSDNIDWPKLLAATE